MRTVHHIGARINAAYPDPSRSPEFAAFEEGQARRLDKLLKRAADQRVQDRASGMRFCWSVLAACALAALIAAGVVYDETRADKRPAYAKHQVSNISFLPF